MRLPYKFNNDLFEPGEITQVCSRSRALLHHLRAVAANGLDRATFHRLFTERFLLRRFRLLVYVGMSTIVVTTEVRGRGFTAKIAVYALVIDVELSFDILGIFICGVGHFLKLVKTSGKVG